jgi:hypothetical protein
MVAVRRFAVLLVALLGVFSADTAMAQVQLRQYGYDPFLDRPALSPYYNLMRREGGTSVNYYSLVRPQIDAAERARSQQKQIQQLQQQVSRPASQAGTGVTTGHPSYFMNLSHFYPSLGAGSSPGRSAGRQSQSPFVGTQLRFTPRVP